MRIKIYLTTCMQITVHDLSMIVTFIRFDLV